MATFSMWLSGSHRACPARRRAGEGFRSGGRPSGSLARVTDADATEPIHRPSGSPNARRPTSNAILGREPNHLELAMYAVMWREHCSYKSSRIHLKRLPTEGAGVLVGPGRERRRDRRRRRHRRRHPHREPQPPVGHRALPGRGHRRRRHPARHLHHGRPPDRRDGPAALRPARRRPQPLDRRGRGERASPATATRSACRPSAARSIFDACYARQPAGQRAVPRRAAGRPAGARPGHRAPATWPCCSARPPGATASAA